MYSADAEAGSSNSDYLITAMALSGFSGFTSGENQSSIWVEQCRSLGSKLSNPYLRAMFAFLTSNEDDSYENILVTNNSIASLNYSLTLSIPNQLGLGV